MRQSAHRRWRTSHASELGAQLSDRSGEAQAQSELAHAREEAAKVEQDLVLQAAVASESRARAALTARVAELEEQLELQRSDARSVSNIDIF